MSTVAETLTDTPTAVPDRGVKHDGGKPDLSLNPPVALREMALAFGFGAWKYSPFNFEAGLSSRRLLSAALRHIEAVLDGAEMDEEQYTHPGTGDTRASGAHHLGHALASLAMYLRCRELGTLRDDRSPNRRGATLPPGVLRAADLSGEPSPGVFVEHHGTMVLARLPGPGLYRRKDGSVVALVRARDSALLSDFSLMEDKPDPAYALWYGYRDSAVRPAGATVDDESDPMDLVEYLGVSPDGSRRGVSSDHAEGL